MGIFQFSERGQSVTATLFPFKPFSFKHTGLSEQASTGTGRKKIRRELSINLLLTYKAYVSAANAGAM